MIKSGKQYYLYNASWICQNGWPWLPPPHTTCTFDPVTHWESEELRCLNLSCLWHLVLHVITNVPSSHVFFFFLSQVILINGWETKETLPAATNYPMLQLPFLIHKCVKCLRNEKWKKKISTAAKINPLVDRGCGCLSEFPSFPYPKVQFVNKKIIWSCFAIIKDWKCWFILPGFT